MVGNAYNFLLIGCGAAGSVCAFVSYLQKAFRMYTSSESIRLYDSDTLWKAEAEPERLSKAATLSFRTVKSDYDKRYLGFFEPCDESRIYKRLFSSLGDDWKIPPATPYFSKQSLFAVLNGDLREETEAESPFPSDVEISYRYEEIANGRSCARVSCHLNGDSTKDPGLYLAWCDSVIQELDARFPACFRSAYLSYAPVDSAVLHETLYRKYDVSRLERFLLGAEWSVYTGNGILPKNTDLFSVRPLQNGVQYRANAEIRQFDNSLRETLYAVLQNLLMPAYSVHTWSEVWNHRKHLPLSPQTVHVFYDPCNADDPTILFSYQMELSQIRKLDEVRGMEFMGSFSHRRREEMK